jgi:hypothetical protein
MPGALMRKEKLLEFIDKEIHAEFMIVEELNGMLTIEPPTGSDLENSEEGSSNMSIDIPTT